MQADLICEGLCNAGRVQEFVGECERLRVDLATAWLDGTERVRVLEKMVRRLRVALELCADPEDGWPEIECADAFEASRRLVPDASI